MEWRLLLRIQGLRTTFLVGPEGLELPRGPQGPCAVAAIVQASPRDAPFLQVADSWACDMVPHVEVKARVRGLKLALGMFKACGSGQPA